MTVDAEPDPSKRGIESAVADEWRRRRRVSRFYLALLLIPIAGALYAAWYGESERAVVAKSVVPEVTERVKHGLDARVGERVRVEAPPVVRSEIAGQVEPALIRIRNDQATLASTLASVQARSMAFAAVAPEVPELRTAVGEFDGKLIAVRQEVADAKLETATRFQTYEPDLKRLPKLFGDVEQLRTLANNVTSDIADVKNRLGRMDDAVSRIGALATRVSAAEATLQRLNDRVAKLEALGSTVDRLDKRVSKIESAWTAVQQLDKRVMRLEGFGHWTSPPPVEPLKP